MLNTAPLNAQQINGASATASVDWESLSPEERIHVYVLDVGELRLPIRSAQAAMRLAGQSFLQVVAPGADQYVDQLEELRGQPMQLRAGYRFADGSLSPLEIIASVPFQQVRSDEGMGGMTLTLSGYGAQPTPGSNERELRGIRYRTIETTGKRRVRASIDLFLRPGQQALDSDGTAFPVGIIQYFISPASDFMEVLQDG